VSARSTSVCALAALAAVVAAPGASQAMGIVQERRLLAHSADGRSALYEVRGRGPEGGGSLAYRVEGKVRRKSVEFLVSSNFSPGGSSQPQLVPVSLCEQRLDALSTELATRGFRGIAVSPERCRTPDRDGLVTIATLPPALTPITKPSLRR